MKILLYKAGDDKSHKELGQKLRELPEGEYVISVKKNRPIRSMSANRFYHVILNLIAIETGHTHEQLHEIMKLKFNSELINLPKGGTQIVGNSTSNLDSAEFSSYVTRVKQFAQDEFGIIIPDARDMDYMKEMEIQNQYSQTFSGY